MKLLISFLLAMFMGTSSFNNESIYDFTLTNIDGKSVALSEYKGKVILVVNVASKCGFTPQYAELQDLYESYKDDGLVILGFPANNFMGQEPGSDEDINEFCTLTYGVEFPMFSKVSVKGSDQSELFKYLTDAENKDFTGEVKWNFEKFLIDKEGNLQRRFRSNVKPSDSDLVSSVKSLL